MTAVIIIAVAMLSLLTYAGVEKLRQAHVLRQHVPVIRTVTVTLTADTSGFTAAMQRAAAATSQLGTAALEAKLRRFGNLVEVCHAGVETKWWVRGTMYARLGYPDTCVDVEVQAALHEPLFPEDAAAAFIRGWVEHRPAPVDTSVAAARALPLDPHPMYDELVAP